MPHFTLDLRAEFRAGVVDPFLAGYAAGETPNPCVGCNGHVRLDAMLDIARRAGRGRRSPPATTRGSRDDGLLRVAADPAKDQTYMLAALSPASLARMRFPLAELTKPEVRALAAEAELPVASAAPSRRTCASWPGPARRAFLAAPRGARGRAGGDRVGAGDGRSAPTTASTTSPSASARGWAWRRPSRCTCCAPRRARTASWSARATSWPSIACACAAPGCTGRAPRSTRVRLRYHSRAVPCRVAGIPGRGDPRALELELAGTLLRRGSGAVRVPASRRRDRRVGDNHTMTREEMLRSLQDDVDAWPQSVKDAGVKNAAGSAFRPVARNNEILRTPEDPEVTYAYMIARLGGRRRRVRLQRLGADHRAGRARSSRGST